MKLLFVIDHLGLGGAQRQMVELACGLKKLGHSVAFFVYFPEYDFFASRLAAAGIVIHRYRKGRGFSPFVIWRIVALIRKYDFDLVLAYLNSPSIYAELARLFARGPRLVVSERCSHHDDRSPTGAALRRVLHQLAEALVSNSQTHAAWLRTRWRLSGKVIAIYNGFDLDSFGPGKRRRSREEEIRLLAVGRICPQKNLINLIEGLRIFQARNGYVPSVSWVGERDLDADGKRYGDSVQASLDRNPEIKKCWHWLGSQSDIRSILNEHDALIHPSRYEGLPNAVCEALATGMPVLVSDVCDHSLLVEDGRRGFLFHPESPESIAAAVQKLANLSLREWAAFSTDARMYAVDHLALGGMVRAYETLFSSLVNRQ